MSCKTGRHIWYRLQPVKISWPCDKLWPDRPCTSNLLHQFNQVSIVATFTSTFDSLRFFIPVLDRRDAIHDNAASCLEICAITTCVDWWTELTPTLLNYRQRRTALNKLNVHSKKHLQSAATTDNPKRIITHRKLPLLCVARQLRNAITQWLERLSSTSSIYDWNHTRHADNTTDRIINRGFCTTVTTRQASTDNWLKPEGSASYCQQPACPRATPLLGLGWRGSRSCSLGHFGGPGGSLASVLAEWITWR